jgi:phosphoribosylanthranilate isomerase
MGYRVRVKICGITNRADLDAAVAAGADAVGLNFHPPSPRSVTPDAARELLAGLPPFVEAVGVFVNRKLGDLRDLLTQLGRVTTVQVHGGPHEVVEAYPYRFVPAFQVREAADLDAIRRYLDSCSQANALPAAILIDGHAPGLVGGTGQKAPWDLLAEFRPGVPMILAGGLTPDNVAEAVRRVRPYAVDVASGVESSPGQKDAEKVRRFIREALQAAQSI